MFEELKRRNVFKAGGAYLLLAWLLVQISSILVPALLLPDWVQTFVVFLLILGFPVVLILAWALDLTPDGIKAETTKVPVSVQKFLASRQIDFVIMGLMALVILYLLSQLFLPSDEPAQKVAEVNPATTETQIEAPSGDPSAQIRKSIAVLPFVNMSSDSEQEFFSDGLSEEILNLLAKNRDLKVIGRTSSFAYKGKNEDLRVIGEELDVQTVLEGSVRKSADKIRITAQLIEVEGGTHLWSETYDRELTDVTARKEQRLDDERIRRKCQTSSTDGEYSLVVQ